MLHCSPVACLHAFLTVVVAAAVGGACADVACLASDQEQVGTPQGLPIAAAAGMRQVAPGEAALQLRAAAGKPALPPAVLLTVPAVALPVPQACSTPIKFSMTPSISVSCSALCSTTARCTNIGYSTEL